MIYNDTCLRLSQERIHVLKLMNSFPSAKCIEDIETQRLGFK